MKIELEELFDELAERAVLGGMIVEPELIAKAITQGLTLEDFYFEHHRKLFSFLLALYQEYGKNWDDVVMRDYALKTGFDLNMALVYKLLDEASVGELWDFALTTVKEKALIRKAQELSLGLLKAKSFEEVLQAVDGLSTLKEQKLTQNKTFKEDLEEGFKRLKALWESGNLVRGVATGFLDLDLLTSGFSPGQLIVVGARPGMGKTSLMLSWAMHVAKSTRVGIFSLEMTKSQLLDRMISIQSGIPLQKIRRGFLNDEEWEKVVNAFLELRKLNLFWDDTPAQSIVQIKAKARWEKLEVVFVDYLQLVKTEKRLTRQEEVAQISIGLKTLAKELNIPVIALAQLNRASEHRADKRPTLADLRESGQIEQDADVVMFLHRPEYYKRQDPSLRGKAELIVDKNRDGATGIIRMHFDASTTKFSPASEDATAPQEEDQDFEF